MEKNRENFYREAKKIGKISARRERIDWERNRKDFCKICDEIERKKNGKDFCETRKNRTKTKKMEKDFWKTRQNRTKRKWKRFLQNLRRNRKKKEWKRFLRDAKESNKRKKKNGKDFRKTRKNRKDFCEIRTKQNRKDFWKNRTRKKIEKQTRKRRDGKRSREWNKTGNGNASRWACPAPLLLFTWLLFSRGSRHVLQFANIFAALLPARGRCFENECCESRNLMIKYTGVEKLTTYLGWRAWKTRSCTLRVCRIYKYRGKCRLGNVAR